MEDSVKIHLKDFYSDDIYLLKLEGERSLFIKLNKCADIACKGFYAKENCGFLSNKIEKEFAIFVNKGEIIFICDRRIIRVMKDHFSVSRFVLVPLITIITIKSNGCRFRCMQWSRNVDPFYMDDFFYYIRYQVKMKFENFVGYWNSSLKDSGTNRE